MSEMYSDPRHRFCTIQSHPKAPVQGVARWEWQALSKGHNAEMALWGGSLRASQEGASRAPKEVPLGCKACLAGNGEPLSRGITPRMAPS
jgi:hypothetical protein